MPPQIRYGHFAGDPTDPRNRIEPDGLSENQRNYLKGFVRDCESGNVDNRPARTWTSKLIELPDGTFRWVTREEWDRLLKSGERATPTYQPRPFRPDFFPQLGKWIESESQLKREMKAQGKEFRF